MSQCGATAQRRRAERTRVRHLLGPTVFFPLAREIIGTATWPDSLGMQAEPSPIFAHRARPRLNCKNEYLMLALGKETAAKQ